MCGQVWGRGVSPSARCAPRRSGREDLRVPQAGVGGVGATFAVWGVGATFGVRGVWEPRSGCGGVGGRAGGRGGGMRRRRGRWREHAASEQPAPCGCKPGSGMNSGVTARVTVCGRCDRPCDRVWPV
eukprot:363450-Chlamydomonas_euryale.AAC.5